MRTVPAFRRRLRRSLAFIRDGEADRYVERWRREWQPDQARQLAALRRVEVASLDGVGLADHLEAAAGFVQTNWDRHFHLTLPMIAIPDLVFLCHDLLGWDEQRALSLLPGQLPRSSPRVLSEDDFDKVRPGDILVSPVTSPVWSVLFGSIGALVTDSGGILSHPAIIAREFGIPAVVATGNGTALLRDGQQATVDGAGGTVTIEA